MEELAFITPPGNIGIVQELDDFVFQIEVSDPLAILTVTGGVFPMNLAMSEGGLISGTVIDMDEYVPSFEKPHGFVISRDGSNYASFGSAEAGVFECVFEVTATGELGSAVANFSITVLNNWSSDRDQLIRDYSEEYGDDGEIFEIDDVAVDAETYITYQKNRGFFI